jgi:tetratricopeptide (TPR) repeat protein
MYRKYFLNFFVVATVVVVGGVSAFAQTGALRGKVMMKQADGTSAPATNAVVDVYRLDIPSKQENIKPNKRGEFNILGLFITGKYVLSVSAPGASPKIRTNIKAGQDAEYLVTLDPGDGRRYTMDEARKLASGDADTTASSGGGGESAEDKAKREELMRKNAEIDAGNKKIEAANSVVRRTFEEGGKALDAKKYDEAVTLYSEGLAADPEQAALLTNKSIALRMRGAERYNAAVQSKDEAAKTSGLEAARKDFRESAESATKAVELVKAMPNPADPTEQARQLANKRAAVSARADAMKIFVTKVDPTKADDGYAAFQDFIGMQTDNAIKLKAQLDSAQMLFDAGAVDKAVAEYQKILTTNPDNVEAMLGAGLALFGTGDADKYQEAANYLQRFVDNAPDTHAFKADAKAVLEELKRQNVKPQKTAPTGRRRG